MSKWHSTDNPYTAVVEVAHELEPQEVVARPGAGRGVVEIAEGHHVVHPVVMDICKLDPVWRVVVGEGYLVINIKHPRFWPTVQGEIIRIVALRLES